MKTLLKFEELGLVLLSVFLFNQLDYAWWWYLALFLTPDLSMLGYLHTPKTGAFTYNLIHHKGVAVAVYFTGMFAVNPALQLAGLVLLGHSSFDRVFGYGLKYPDSFQHTHLGTIGPAAKQSSVP